MYAFRIILRTNWLFVKYVKSLVFVTEGRFVLFEVGIENTK